MNRGTKSILFGVHQFLWHPLTVARAWKDCFGCWPAWNEWVAVICHDLGYWGKPNMDGAEGQLHPIGGALLTGRIVYWLGRLRGYSPKWATKVALYSQQLSLYHSRYFCRLADSNVSSLFLPDKLCVRYDPSWFYILRARLSGELAEYLENAEQSGRSFSTPRQWYKWYREKVEGFCGR